MYYLYAVNKKKLVCHDKAEYETYGLVCIGIKNGFSYVLAEINDVSTDFEYVKKLSAHFTTNQLSHEHIYDALENSFAEPV